MRYCYSNLDAKFSTSSPLLHDDLFSPLISSQASASFVASITSMGSCYQLLFGEGARALPPWEGHSRTRGPFLERPGNLFGPVKPFVRGRTPASFDSLTI